MNSKISSFAEHPGVYIRDEIEARKWSQRDLAFILGTSEQSLNRLLAGKHGISPDMARSLGAAFEMSPEFFSNLQSAWDLRNARDPDPAISKRAHLQNVYPIRAMIARGWIEATDAPLLELQVERFFEDEAISFAAKKSDYHNQPPEQIAWLYRVRQLAKHQTTPKYDADALLAIIPKLKSLAIEPEGVGEVSSLLNSCGVKIVFVEILPGAKIDGACTWLDDMTPVIGMSTMHDRVDNFWFVLRHEIEHVLRGDGKDTAIIDNLEGDASGSGANLPIEERLANDAAAEFCVPKEKMNSFFVRKNPYFSDSDIVGFAAVMGVHPALIVGQLHHRTKKYAHFRKYLLPVRKHLLNAAKTIVDGWDNVIAIGL